MFKRIVSTRAFRRRIVSMLLAPLIFASCGGARAQDPISEFFGGLFGGGGNPHIIQRSQPSARRPRERTPMRRIVPRATWEAAPREPRHWRPERRVEKPAHRQQPAWSQPERAYGHGREAAPEHVRRPVGGAAPERAQRPANAAAPAEAPANSPAAEADFFVTVMGDSLGGELADGIEEAFEDTPEIGVIHKFNDSSGLVRADYFDWLKAARDIAADKRKPDLAIVMLGSNDRQPIEQGGRAYEPLSEDWRTIYTSRVEALIGVFKEKNIPVVWVGLPIMKAERFSADMTRINDIFRASATKLGVPYIDIWDVFAGEHGQYAAFGPDVIGQNALLRTSDGVHFTAAGARKLASFVESEIKRRFDARRQPAPAAAATTPAPAANAPQPVSAAPAPPLVFKPQGAPLVVVAPSLPPERPAIGPAAPLTVSASGDDDLARRDKTRPREATPIPVERALVEHVFIEGGALPPRAGRADDFSRPAKPEAGAPKPEATVTKPATEPSAPAAATTAH